MTKAILCSSDDSRAWEIRTSLADVDVSIERQYSSSSTLLSALASLPADEIDLVVIDSVVEPMPVWDIARHVAGVMPSVAVLTVVDNPVHDDYARAMDAGVRGILRYPLGYDDVSQKVTSALGWAQTVRSAVTRQLTDAEAEGTGGRMLTLCSAKGGAGSSTLAVHLARAAQAAAPNRRVVVVDLDHQKPDFSILLNVPQHRTITDLLSVVDELTPRQLEDVLYTSDEGYAVLFGPVHGEESELLSAHAVRTILGTLRSHFDIVIVDIGSVMGEANASAVEMADEVCIVSTCDVLSLRGARRINQLWTRLGLVPADAAKVILNRTDKRSDIQPEAAKKIVGLPVISPHVPETRRMLELAVNRRDPGLAGPAWAQKISELGVALGVVPAAGLDVVETRRGRRKRRRTADAQQELARSEAGQGSLEFLGIITLIGLIAAIGFQLVLVGMTWTFAANAANEGARAAAVSQSAERAARSHTPAAWQDGMSVRHGAGEVTVTLDTPLLVNISDDFRFTIPASAGVVREP